MMLPQKSEFAKYWSINPNTVFLNHGSFGATTKLVLEEQDKLRNQLESDPVWFLEEVVEEMWLDSILSLSNFLNADPKGMAFLSNATSGVNTVLKSLSLNPGDEIIVPNHTYQACWNAVDFVASRTGAETVIVEIPFPVNSKEEIIEPILENVSRKTRLAIIDTVSSPTGIRMPFEDLIFHLQSKKVDVLLDAAHGPGIVPLDLKKLKPAYCAGNLHKWICTPKGSAFLHIREDKIGGIRPLSISHGASVNGTIEEKFRFEFDWQGTCDPTPWLCIPKAISHIENLVDGGWSEVMRRNRELVLAARKILSEELGLDLPCPDSMIASLASIIIPNKGEIANSVFDTDPLHSKLIREFGIQVPVFNWPHHDRRYLRISAHLYNHIDEYKYLAKVLSDLI